MSLFEPTVSFDLDAWPEASRRELDALAHQRGIETTWTDGRVAVDVGTAPQVDDLVGYLNGTSAPGATRAAPWGGPGARGPAPGWYANPEDAATWRWWDGDRWTAFTEPVPDSGRLWFPPASRRAPDGAAAAGATTLRGGGGIALVGFVVAQLASIGAVLLAIELGASRRSVLTLVIGAVAFWGGLLLACVVAVRRHGTGTLRDLGLTGLQRRDWGTGVVVSVIARVAGAAAAAGLILALPDESYGESTSLVERGSPSVLAAIVVSLVVVIGAPFFEELFFRGLVQVALTRRIGARAAVVVQAVAFGAVHYQIGMAVADVVITVSVVSIAGLALGAVRWHAERLEPGMVAHAAFNLVAVVVTFLVL